MMSAHMLALFCLAAFLARFALRCRVLRRGAGQLHAVIWVLAAGTGLQWAGHCLHVLHLAAYSANGVGAPGVDLLAEVFFMLSQVVSATLFIAIAQGYTLLRSRLQDCCGVLPIACSVAALHVFLVGFGKLQGETSYKYHENEGFVGWMLLAVRMLLFSWFVTGIQRLKLIGGCKMGTFVIQFQLVGSLYFLACPAIFIVAQLLAPYLRHPVLHLGLPIIQSVASSWLAHLFLSARGTYYEVSTLSSSLLPGCAGFLQRVESPKGGSCRRRGWASPVGSLAFS